MNTNELDSKVWNNNVGIVQTSRFYVKHLVNENFSNHENVIIQTSQMLPYDVETLKLFSGKNEKEFLFCFSEIDLASAIVKEKLIEFVLFLPKNIKVLFIGEDIKFISSLSRRLNVNFHTYECNWDIDS